MPRAPKGVSACAALALLVIRPVPASAAEAGVEVSGKVGIGYDSNYFTLGSAKNIPPPHLPADGDSTSGLWTLGTDVVGWVRPVDMLEITLEPGFRLIHFFDNELVLEPVVDMSVYLYPTPVFGVGAGGGYRYYRFSVFEEDRFHEPHAWFELALTPGNQKLWAVYGYAHRRMPAVEGMKQDEHSALLAWAVSIRDVVEIGIGFRYEHVRGSETWMQLDALKALLSAEMEWRMLDAGVVYTIGSLWFEQDGVGMLNRVSAWFGGRYPGWIRYGVEYSYEDLMDLHELPITVPYDRHVFIFSVTFSWDGRIPRPAEEPAGEGEEGIVVTGRGAVFSVCAPDASSVSLVGSFDGWQEPGASFEGPDSDGMWTLEMDLEPGRHEVVYVIDGEVVVPPGAAATTDDELGGTSAVVVVP